jgi:hypothetical protein
MLKLVLALALLALSVSEEVIPYYCKTYDRTIQTCSGEYQPICGFFNEGGNRMFGSICEACRYSNVRYVMYGQCPINTGYLRNSRFPNSLDTGYLSNTRYSRPIYNNPINIRTPIDLRAPGAPLSNPTIPTYPRDPLLYPRDPRILPDPRIGI